MIRATGMHVTAAVLHFRRWPQVRETLDALLAQSRPPDLALVVDNGSGDGSAQRLGDAYPALDVISVEPNRGPIGGMNVALSSALERGTEAVLLLTDDCTLAPDALEHLLARLEGDEAVGATAPLLAKASEPGRLSMAGGTIDRRTWDTHAIEHPPLLADWKERGPFPIEWHNSSALLLRSDAARAAGLFHERLRYYYDEPDYLMRLPELGWRLECVPAAVAWYDVGEPSPETAVRSRLIFLSRRAPRWILARELARVPYLAALDLVRGRGTAGRSAASLRIKGLLAFLTGR